jgi:hypothetical protein
MMRNLMLLAAAYYGLQAGYETAQRWRPDPAVESAVDIRCGSVAIDDRVLCEDGLRQEFEIGASEPTAVLRKHCTRWRGPWSAVRPAGNPESGLEAPALCVERYGGWIQG